MLSSVNYLQYYCEIFGFNCNIFYLCQRYHLKIMFLQRTTTKTIER